MSGSETLREWEPLVMDALRSRHGGNEMTRQKLQSEAVRLFAYWDAIGIKTLNDLGAEPTIEWCWKPRFNNKTKLGRVSESTARNRQWVALEVLNTFVRLGADINPRELIGERVARPSTYVSTRPLTAEEDRIVRRRAESKLARSRMGMLVGLSYCGGTAKEIAALRVCDIDLDTQTVSFGGRSARVNPLDEWTVTMTRRFFANHDDGLVNGDEPLCVSDSIGEVRGAQSVAVRLGRLLQEAGLKGTARRVCTVDPVDHRAACPRCGRHRSRCEVPGVAVVGQRSSRARTPLGARRWLGAGSVTCSVANRLSAWLMSTRQENPSSGPVSET